MFAEDGHFPSTNWARHRVTLLVCPFSLDYFFLLLFIALSFCLRIGLLRLQARCCKR